MTTKGNFPHLDVAKLFLLIVATAIAWGFLFSCKPIKETIIEQHTVTIYDTIKGKDGKDSIVFKNVVVEIPKETIKTRYQVRFEYKRFNDSLKHVRKVYSDLLRYVLKHEKIVIKYKYKEQKQEVKKEIKKNRRFTFPIIIIALLIIIILAFRFK